MDFQARPGLGHLSGQGWGFTELAGQGPELLLCFPGNDCFTEEVCMSVRILSATGFPHGLGTRLWERSRDSPLTLWGAVVFYQKSRKSFA